jgi:hypothetical protein
MSRRESEQDADKSQRRASLTRQQGRIMLAGILRRETLFNMAQPLLKSRGFADSHETWDLIFTVAASHYDQHDALPTKSIVLTELASLLHRSPGAYSPRRKETFRKEVKLLYSIPERDLSDAYTLEKFQWYMSERLLARVREASEAEGTPVALPQLLSEMADDAASLVEITSDDIELPFPEDWRPKSIGVHGTGVDFLDKFLRGGHAKREVYGLLGPYNTCKTPLMLQISIEGARAFYEEYLSGSSEVGIAYHFTYEEALDPVRLRSISYAALIDRERLEDHDGDEHLSTGENLLDYEKELFADALRAGQRVAGERGRMQRAKKYLNLCWKPEDMTGSATKNRLRGTGGAREIAQLIRCDLERKRSINPRCRLVTVDYAGAAISRFMSAGDLPLADFRHYLGRFPLELKNHVANVFDCPVWVAHQLNADSNARTSSRLSHHTDAAEARNFAENLDFCLNIGTKSPENLCMFGSSKNRRTKRTDPIIIRIEGQYGRISAAEDWMVDVRRNRLVPVSDFNRTHRPDEDEEHDTKGLRKLPPMPLSLPRNNE